MRTILVLNSKGGCGKSTISTNLAAHYALQRYNVALADFDPQGSSLAWLKARPATRATILGIDACKDTLRPPRETEILILDAPAGVEGAELTALVKRAQTILIPVLPSATDIRAAARFVQNLLLVGKVERKQTRVATIANRVPDVSQRENMLAKIGIESLNVRLFRPLERFLHQLKIPMVATLPDSPCYAIADQQGLSVFEIHEERAALDRDQSRQLIGWLDCRQSLPRGG